MVERNSSLFCLEIRFILNSLKRKIKKSQLQLALFLIHLKGGEILEKISHSILCLVSNRVTDTNRI